MNPIKIAATIALTVALGATAYLVYVMTVVKSAQDKAADSCASCQMARDNAAMKWKVDEEKIRAAELAGGELARLAAERAYAGDRPVILGPCSGCDFPPPDYETPGAVAVLGLVTSLVLFGVAKRVH